MTLKDKHAIVTGGGTGIGLAITHALVEAGATVTIMGRNKTRLDEVADTNDALSAIQVDVTDPKSVDTAFKQASEFSPISILVNNAGAALAAPFHKTSLTAWQNTIAVNLTSVYLTTSAAFNDLKNAAHGRIINIASIAGIEGCAYTTAYSASKHGVMGLTKSLALELTKTTTTANAICPGFTRTDMVEQSINNVMKQTGRSRDDALNDILVSVGQKRIIEPKEIAAEVLKLCDEKNDAINGQAIVIDGR
ncbi:MAG: SDR family oxidoreductase [Kordiimonadaceae bacterium]|jgi:3-hydroxybutyrate dehydrogenase|nr:SDR family oxidoreductase [Kordiimonadaceae bacterium]MBT6036369.1 SDR family oxidoreductase [Kordiimonadaceae bacterium]MBT6328441.1 SDR family oxidoreductase [Kordiimonadaceae bacterium]